MTRRIHFFRWEDQPLEKVTEMVARKAIASGHASLTQAYLKKGAVVPQHAHAADIILYVLQGALRVGVEGEEDLIVREGEVAVVTAGARYQTESLDDTFVLTVAAAS
jgi:quercetin dioxygenase-like cupin family protein